MEWINVFFGMTILMFGLSIVFAFVELIDYAPITTVLGFIFFAGAMSIKVIENERKG